MVKVWLLELAFISALYNIIIIKVASTEGLTATCAAAFGLPNLTNWNWRLKEDLANNKVKQKRAKERKK